MWKRTTKYLTLTSILLALSACQEGTGPQEAETSHPSIYSKTPGTTNLNDLSAVSSVVSIAKNHTPLCSGVAVSKGYILTAAHCVSSCGTAGKYDCSVIGQPDIYLVTDTAGNEYQVDAIALPNRVNVTNNVTVEGADIALLRLRSDFRQKTASIATQDAATSVLEENQDRLESPSNTLIAAGYGAFDDTNKPTWYDGKLRAAYVPFRFFAGIQDNDEILAGSTKVHAAKGDSGGPLLIDNGSGVLQVTGIASRMYTLDSINTFDTDGIYYANVSQPRLRQWIQGKMQEFGGSTETNTVDQGPVHNGSGSTEMASFSNLAVSDVRQFMVTETGDAAIDILVRGKAVDLVVKRVEGQQQLTKAKINPGSTVRVAVNFPQTGIHSLEFKCSGCDGTKIEALKIQRL